MFTFSTARLFQSCSLNSTRNQWMKIWIYAMAIINLSEFQQVERAYISCFARIWIINLWVLLNSTAIKKQRNSSTRCGRPLTCLRSRVNLCLASSSIVRVKPRWLIKMEIKFIRLGGQWTNMRTKLCFRTLTPQTNPTFAPKLHSDTPS